MNDSGLIEALNPVAAAFRELGVKFYVGGSVASSFHGASRSTMDVDLVGKLTLKLAVFQSTTRIRVRDSLDARNASHASFRHGDSPMQSV